MQQVLTIKGTFEYSRLLRFVPVMFVLEETLAIERNDELIIPEYVDKKGPGQHFCPHLPVLDTEGRAARANLEP